MCMCDKTDSTLHQFISIKKIKSLLFETVTSSFKIQNMGKGTNLNAFTHRMGPVHDGYFFWHILKKRWNHAYHKDAKMRAHAFVDQ